MTSKVLHRKTKTGSIVKIVREHYLRSDIACGVSNCPDCDHIYEKYNPEILIDKRPRKGISMLYPRPHILIPDAKTIVEQIDVLEDPSFGSNVVILQSVMADVRSQNLNLYTRLKGVIKNSDRKFIVFCNEFHKETFRTRAPKETTLEYANKLVDVAAKWYTEHLKTIDTFVLSNRKSEVSVSCSMKDYVAGLKNNLDLIDKVRSDEDAGDQLKDNMFSYRQHLPLTSLQAGLKNGTFYEGKYKVSSHNYLEGTIYTTFRSNPTEILIQGREDINRAINGDIVAIELLPEAEWKGESEAVVTADVESEKNVDKVESAVQSSRRPTGRVVGIIKRNWRQYCGILKEKKDMTKTMVVTGHMFVPAVQGIPLIRIETRQYDALIGQRIVVAIDSWPQNSKFPRGHYVRALGEIGNVDVEREMILLQFDVPFEKFTPAVMKCLPQDPDNFQIPEEEYLKRLDLRDETVCSVDPPGCTDIDDALHCKVLPNGDYEVGVHIADVSYFVKAGSELDKEAAKRGTTVYLTDKRIDMIPTVLSSNLCSLIEDKERLTFSVIWVMNPKTAAIKETKFTKSVIKSKAAMTYAHAQMKIDSVNTKDEVSKSLRRLNKMAKIMRKNRVDSGALILASGGEVRFIEVESETHDNVTQIESKQMRDTNSMIEEFMLLANISVADKMYKTFPELALLRKHEESNQLKFEQFLRMTEARGIRIDISSGKELSRSLDEAKDPSNPYLDSMLRMLTTQCLNRATYFCGGSVDSSAKNFEHYGIGATIYTHFTSPIRRYADLSVHRILSFAIGASNLDANIRKESIEKLCENINIRHKNAQEASRSSQRLHTLLFVKKQSASRVVEHSAYILAVKTNCLEIFIPDLALRLLYYLDDNWKHNEKTFSQTQKSTKIKLRQFDRITVQLGIVDKSNDYKRGYEQVDTLIVKPPIDKRLKSS